MAKGLKFSLLTGLLWTTAQLGPATENAHAACAATTRTWDADNNNRNWDEAANWSGDDRPDTTSENVVVVADTRDVDANLTTSISCLEIQSGQLNDTAGQTLSITGDYFRNLLINGLTVGGNSTWVLRMAGTAAQTFENVDRIANVEITNNTSVTFTDSFELTKELILGGGWTGTLYINADLRMSTNQALTIPSGGKIVIGTGVTVESTQNLTVDGVLELSPGASLRMTNNRTLTISSTGQLKMNGAAGNVAMIGSLDSSDDINVDVAGFIDAEYFRFERLNPAGVDVTGTIQKMQNGEFRFLHNNGAGITLGAAATVPSTMDNLGFFNDDGVANADNIDATNFNVSDVTLNNWSGGEGGASNEVDPNGRINWGTEETTQLVISDVSAANEPPNTINADVDQIFGAFGFSLTKADTATNITQVVFTMVGTASISDIQWVRVTRDDSTSRNCNLDAGTDVDITGQVSLSGSPPTVTVNIPSGDVSTASDSDMYCIYIEAHTTASAADDKTIRFSIESTGDVTNSQSYGYSVAGGPPVTAGYARINGTGPRRWDGQTDSVYQRNNNWDGAFPDNTRDCEIGAGINPADVDSNPSQCKNALLMTGGELDWNGTTNEFEVHGSLEVDTGYTFTAANTGPGVIAMEGTTSQSISLATAFPGNMTINNSGTAGNNIVGVNGDSTVEGDMTVSAGVLKINSPNTLTVEGDLNCTGGTLEIEPGATLELGNGSTLTIGASCTLTMVGTSSDLAVVTSNGGSAAYNVVVNGTIQAQYYKFDHLDTAGVSIESGASIDSTYHLQNGSFTYPVNNNTTLLSLKRKVPTNSMDDMTFSLEGSSATGTTNIDTTGPTGDTLTINNYTGDVAGPSYDTDPSYLVSWLGATNTIDITQEATSPGSLAAGSTYNMGRFGFQQTLAGASYSDTDLTSLTLTLTGTASANDISAVRTYYDDNCDGASGILIDSGTFSGFPATVTFTYTAGEATIEADNTSPPKRCIYVEYDVSLSAVGGNTAGVEIAASGDFANSQSYALSSSTPAPITLGSAGTITAATTTSWLGGTSTDWFTAANWDAGLPDSTKDCIINVGSNNPNINGGTGTAVCKGITIGTGTLTLQNSTGAVLEIYGGFSNSGTINQNDGTIQIRDDGVTPTNQTVSSNSTLSALTFNKTAGGSGAVIVGGTTLTITTLTIPASSDFDFQIPNGKTLSLGSSLTFADAVLEIQGGGTLNMANSTTLTVNSGGTLKMVGSSGNLATLTSSGSYEVSINTGEIEARYYEFNRLGTNGVSIESGATINTTNHLQDGSFTYPVNNNSTLLNLKRQVPSNSMDNANFDLDGSSATGTTNIDTTGASAGTLTINSYSGDLSGPSFDTDPTYAISWTGAVNTIDLTQEATTPGALTAGSTYNMGRFGFEQTLAGASFSDTDITSLRLTLTGTAENSDIAAARIFYDSGCAGSGGTQIGTGTFTGNPGTINFSLSGGDATVQSDAANPPLRCIYVEYDIAGGAVDSRTAGAQIATSSHLSNDQGFDLAPGTPAPVTLGTPGTISGSTVTTWTGSTDTDWFTAANWDAGLPDSTKNCIIPNVTNDPNVNGGTGTAICKSVTINSGGVLTLQNSTAAVLEVHGDYANSGTLTQNDGTLRIEDGGGGDSHTISSNSAISSLTFDKTTGGTVSVAGSILQVTTLTFPGGSDFTFEVPNGKTLIIGSNTTLQDATLEVDPGGTLKMTNGTTLTVNTGGILKMVGTSGNYATMTSSGSSFSYNVVINTGEINARYYTFDHLGTNGVSIESGATINSTNHLQDGEFTYPVNNNSTLLFLKRQVPTNSMDNTHFDLDGSGATGTTNVDTTGASAGTLTIDSYTGDVAGPTFDTDPTYTISWTGALNTIDLTQEATTPASLDAGSTYNLGRWGFEQTLAGASFNNTDLTSLKVTMTGTALSSDISEIRVFYDSDCNGSAGSQIGSGTVSGSPLSRTFSFSGGDATIQSDVSNPPMRCIYLEADIAAGAIDNRTLGAEIALDSDVANSEAYAIAGGTPAPVNLGTPGTINGATTTVWTGSTDTDWFTASNWSGGVPSDSISCQISNVTNDPVINGGSGTAVCDNVNISGGTVTLTNATSAVWEVHGNFDNTGTVTQNDGTIRFEDGGSGSNHTLSSNTLNQLTFDKTSGGTISISGDTTINTLTIPGGSNFELKVTSGNTLTLPNGFSLPAATFTVESGGTVEVGDTQSITVSGGTFQTTGVNDTFYATSSGQNLTNKGRITVDGAGRWGFSATSGSVALQGFLLEYLDTSGLNISGTANLSQLDGGQFVQLPTTAGMRAIQLNTSTTPTETTAQNVGWMFGAAANSSCTSAPCAIDSSTNYYLVHASDCNSSTITFDQWAGNFTIDNDQVDTEDKIHDQDDTGPTCQISIAAAASPVSLTQFLAIPFDSSVQINWTTGSEWDHKGFNVYRSTHPAYGFVQINQKLIRNFVGSLDYSGNYSFTDTEVENGVTYYYKIEDVAYSGLTVQHGPVFATPMAGLGSPTAPGSDTNSDNTLPGADPSTIPGVDPVNTKPVDLGNGVHILAQTETGIRVEIIPPTETWSPSPWNGAYEVIEMPGYSKKTEAGNPELAVRSILIEVPSERTSANLTDSSVTEEGTQSHRIAPTPSWTPDSNGILQPSYAEGSAYSNPGLAPNHYFEVENSLTTIGNRKYVRINVTPVKYDPVAQLSQKATKIVLDIGLDGDDAWEWKDTPDHAAPATAANSLIIRTLSSGLYEVTYDELANAGLEGPFDGMPTGDFRVYGQNGEVPIEVNTSTGHFSSGDSVIFHAAHNRRIETDFNQWVLTPQAIDSSAPAPWRMNQMDADPNGISFSSQETTTLSARVEQDLYPQFDLPIGDNEDHFYWRRMFKLRGATPDANALMDIDIEMPHHVRTSQPVRFRLRVRGRGILAVNPTHNLGIWVNNIPYRISTVRFQQQTPTTLTFSIDSRFFFAGTNTVRLEVMADLVPPGDYDWIDLDWMEIDYESDRIAVNDQIEITHRADDLQIDALGFTQSNLAAYSISLDDDTVSRLINVSVTSPNGGSSWDANFQALGEKFVVLSQDQYKTPDEMYLSPGYDGLLRDTAQGADLIVIGGYEQIDAARDLIETRQAEGMRVISAELEQVYAEFSNGLVSSKAIRDFVMYAREHWEAPKVKYLLILGDGTYDPRNRTGSGFDRVTTTPVPIVMGTYMDFGNDNWYATPEGSHTPVVSVGRIPTNDPAIIRTYVQKVLSYEDGETSPTGSHLTFVSDHSARYEGFERDSDRLATTAVQANSRFTTSRVDRDPSNTPDTNTAFIDSFNQESLVLSYMGHGAENMWSDLGVFDNGDATALQNEKLPIVMTLNCLNAHFYDPTITSLGETLIFNPDGGAVAFWGSTTMTIPSVQNNLAKAFINELGSETKKNAHTVRLGDLALKSKTALGETPAHVDTLRSWTLLGDPTLKLPSSAFSTTEKKESSSSVSSAGDNGGGCGGTIQGPGNGGGPGPGPMIFLLLFILLLPSRLTGIRIGMTT